MEDDQEDKTDILDEHRKEELNVHMGNLSTYDRHDAQGDGAGHGAGLELGGKTRTAFVIDDVTKCLKTHMAYELIPNSGKVVVFDSELGVLAAFNGLLQHDLNCAPVWDSTRRKYVGMLSVTDFIDVLRHAHTTHDSNFSPATHRICDWQEIKRKRGTSIGRLLCISPECSLHEAVRLFIEYRIHRLCVVQLALGNTVLCVLSHHHILRFILHQLKDLEKLKLTVQETGVGTWNNVVRASFNTPLIDALNLLIAYRLSSLPIVDDKGVLVNYFSRSDARFLATDGTYNQLDLPINQSLSQHLTGRPVPVCQATEDLWTVLRRFVSSRRHELAVVRPDQTIHGMISLTDVFVFLLGLPPPAPPPVSPSASLSSSLASSFTSSQPQFGTNVPLPNSNTASATQNKSVTVNNNSTVSDNNNNSNSNGNSNSNNASNSNSSSSSSSSSNSNSTSSSSSINGDPENAQKTSAPSSTSSSSAPSTTTGASPSSSSTNTSAKGKSPHRGSTKKNATGKRVISSPPGAGPSRGGKGGSGKGAGRKQGPNNPGPGNGTASKHDASSDDDRTQ